MFTAAGSVGTAQWSVTISTMDENIEASVSQIVYFVRGIVANVKKASTSSVIAQRLAYKCYNACKNR